ncbi:hypothetical protein HaLaN_27950, partial [Haematococcus lacustris]
MVSPHPLSSSWRRGAAGAGAIVKYICRTHGFEEHNGIYAALNRFFKARQHEYTRIGKTYVLTKVSQQLQPRGGGRAAGWHMCCLHLADLPVYPPCSGLP